MVRKVAKWKLLDSKLAFDHKWFKVRQDTVQLPHGPVLDDYFVSLGGIILLVVPVTKQQKFVLVRQYKHAAEEILLEFPAGYLEEGEKPESAAKRELAEETGLSAPKLIQLTKMTNNPTKEVCDIYVYLAKDAVKTQQRNLDQNEAIETVEVTQEELVAMIKDGQIKVSATITAAYLAFEALGLLKHR